MPAPTSSDRHPPHPERADATRTAQHRLNEITRTDPVKGRPSQQIPESVAKFCAKDGNAYRSALIKDKIEFIDRGNRIHAYQPVSLFTVRSLAQIAQARDWKSLEVTGTPAFRQQMYIEAVSKGIAVQGHQPSVRDQQVIERRLDRAAAKTHPIAQAYLGAQTRKARSEAIRQYPQLKQAFAIEEAALRFAADKIDSKAASKRLLDKVRDDNAIALSQGKALQVPTLGEPAAAPKRPPARAPDPQRSR